MPPLTALASRSQAPLLTHACRASAAGVPGSTVGGSLAPPHHLVATTGGGAPASMLPGKQHPPHAPGVYFSPLSAKGLAACNSGGSCGGGSAGGLQMQPLSAAAPHGAGRSSLQLRHSCEALGADAGQHDLAAAHDQQLARHADAHGSAQVLLVPQVGAAGGRWCARCAGQRGGSTADQLPCWHPPACRASSQATWHLLPRTHSTRRRCTHQQTALPQPMRHTCRRLTHHMPTRCGLGVAGLAAHTAGLHTQLGWLQLLMHTPHCCTLPVPAGAAGACAAQPVCCTAADAAAAEPGI